MGINDRYHQINNEGCYLLRDLTEELAKLSDLKLAEMRDWPVALQIQESKIRVESLRQALAVNERELADLITEAEGLYLESRLER